MAQYLIGFQTVIKSSFSLLEELFMLDQILRLIKTGWKVIKELGTIHWLLSILGISIIGITSSIPVWMSWDNDAFPGFAIGFSILVFAMLFLCVPGFLGHRSEKDPRNTIKIDCSNGDRIPLIELFAEAEKDDFKFKGADYPVLKFVDALRQAGLDGKLIFWGRPKRYSTDDAIKREPLNEIPKEHW